MTNTKHLGEDTGWKLYQLTERLSALLDTVENMECFTYAELPDDIEKAHRLICIGNDLTKSAVGLADQFNDDFNTMKDRLSNPQKDDRLPGEVLLELLAAVTPAAPMMGNAPLIAMRASVLARYAEFDKTLNPAVEFLIDQIHKQGFTTKIVDHEVIGRSVEIYQQSNQATAR
ncbi:MAG: hypothetical protein RPU14_03855 [Candidatus Sedimenticola sp. (ex Thyasira tokunagai)]